jgi:hypothetical protein
VRRHATADRPGFTGIEWDHSQVCGIREQTCMAFETRKRSSRCLVHSCEKERSAPNARSDNPGYLRITGSQEEMQKYPCTIPMRFCHISAGVAHAPQMATPPVVSETELTMAESWSSLSIRMRIPSRGGASTLGPRLGLLIPNSSSSRAAEYDICPSSGRKVATV